MLHRRRKSRQGMYIQLVVTLKSLSVFSAIPYSVRAIKISDRLIEDPQSNMLAIFAADLVFLFLPASNYPRLQFICIKPSHILNVKAVSNETGEPLDGITVLVLEMVKASPVESDGIKILCSQIDIVFKDQQGLQSFEKVLKSMIPGSGAVFSEEAEITEGFEELSRLKQINAEPIDLTISSEMATSVIDETGSANGGILEPSSERLFANLPIHDTRQFDLETTSSFSNADKQEMTSDVVSQAPSNKIQESQTLAAEPLHQSEMSHRQSMLLALPSKTYQRSCSRDEADGHVTLSPGAPSGSALPSHFSKALEELAFQGLTEADQKIGGASLVKQHLVPSKPMSETSGAMNDPDPEKTLQRPPVNRIVTSKAQVSRTKHLNSQNSAQKDITKAQVLLGHEGSHAHDLETKGAADWDEVFRAPENKSELSAKPRKGVSISSVSKSIKIPQRASVPSSGRRKQGLVEKDHFQRNENIQSAKRPGKTSDKQVQARKNPAKAKTKQKPNNFKERNVVERLSGNPSPVPKTVPGSFSSNYDQKKPRLQALASNNMPSMRDQIHDQRTIPSNPTREIKIHPQAHDSQNQANGNQILPAQLAIDVIRSSDDETEERANVVVNELLESYFSPTSEHEVPGTKAPMGKQSQNEHDSNPIPEDRRRKLLEQASQSFGFKLTQSLLAQPSLISDNHQVQLQAAERVEGIGLPKASDTSYNRANMRTVADSAVSSGFVVRGRSDRLEGAPKASNNPIGNKHSLDGTGQIDVANRSRSRTSPKLPQQLSPSAETLHIDSAASTSLSKVALPQKSPSLSGEISNISESETMFHNQVVNDTNEDTGSAMGGQKGIENDPGELVISQVSSANNGAVHAQDDIRTENDGENPKSFDDLTAQYHDQPSVQTSEIESSLNGGLSPKHLTECLRNDAVPHDLSEASYPEEIRSNGPSNLPDLETHAASESETMRFENVGHQNIMDATRVVDKSISATMPPPSARKTNGSYNNGPAMTSERLRTDKLARTLEEHALAPHVSTNAATNIAPKTSLAAQTFRTPFRPKTQKADHTNEPGPRVSVGMEQEDTKLLTDESLHRKTSVIRFGRNGPLNQGIPLSPRKPGLVAKYSRNLNQPEIGSRKVLKRKVEEDIPTPRKKSGSKMKKAALSEPSENASIQLQPPDTIPGIDDRAHVLDSDGVPSSNELIGGRLAPTPEPVAAPGRHASHGTKVDCNGSPLLLPLSSEQPVSSPFRVSSKPLFQRLLSAKGKPSTEQVHKECIAHPTTPIDKTISSRLPPSPRHPKATLQSASSFHGNISASSPSRVGPPRRSSEPDAALVNQTFTRPPNDEGNLDTSFGGISKASLADTTRDPPQSAPGLNALSKKERVFKPSEQIESSKFSRDLITAAKTTSRPAVEVGNFFGNLLEPSKTRVRFSDELAKPSHSGSMPPSPHDVIMPLEESGMDTGTVESYPDNEPVDRIAVRVTAQPTKEATETLDEPEVRRATKTRSEQLKQQAPPPPRTPAKRSPDKKPTPSLADIITGVARTRKASTEAVSRSPLPERSPKSTSITADNEITLVDDEIGMGDDTNNIHRKHVCRVGSSESSASSSESNQGEDRNVQEIRAQWRRGLDRAEKSTSDMLHDLSDSLLFRLADAGEGVIFKVRELERGGRWVLESFASAASRHMEGEGVDLEPQRRRQVEAYGQALHALEDTKRNLSKLRGVSELQNALQQKDAFIIHGLETLSGNLSPSCGGTA